MEKTKQKNPTKKTNKKISFENFGKLQNFKIKFAKEEPAP